MNTEMAFLLTEISLDMLGYKYFDIDGVNKLTDFRTTNNTVPLEFQEPNLEELFYPNGSMREVVDTNSTDSDECVEVTTALPVAKTAVNNNDQLIMLNIKESINKEVENLREEIYSMKTKFIEDHLKVIRKRDKNTKTTPNDLLMHYKLREKRNIRFEAEMLDEFLKSVEKRLEEANPELFKAHKRYRMEEFL